MDQDSLALLDARASLPERHVAHLGFATRDDPLGEEPSRGIPEAAHAPRLAGVAGRALVPQAVEVDLVSARLQAAQSLAEGRVVQKGRAAVKVRHHEQRRTHAGGVADLERRLHLLRGEGRDIVDGDVDGQGGLYLPRRSAS
jgi:hypothetical protein